MDPFQRVVLENQIVLMQAELDRVSVGDPHISKDTIEKLRKQIRLTKGLIQISV